MTRIGPVAILVVVTGAYWIMPGDVEAQSAPTYVRPAQAGAPEQPVPYRQPQTRLRVYPRSDYWPDDVYPRYNPGPNAVRECNATYVQEYRPSGTVIVPRMHCWWRPG